jgi:hypothetical protein
MLTITVTVNGDGSGTVIVVAMRNVKFIPTVTYTPLP